MRNINLKYFWLLRNFFYLVWLGFIIENYTRLLYLENIRLGYQADSNAESKETSYGGEERYPSLTGLTAELKNWGCVKVDLFC